MELREWWPEKVFGSLWFNPLHQAVSKVMHLTHIWDMQVSNHLWGLLFLITLSLLFILCAVYTAEV
jgi:hypothetical protein